MPTFTMILRATNPWVIISVHGWHKISNSWGAILKISDEKFIPNDPVANLLKKQTKSADISAINVQ